MFFPMSKTSIGVFSFSIYRQHARNVLHMSALYWSAYMRVAVKIIASVVGLYSIVLLFGCAVGEYYTFNYLSDVSNFKIIVGYPLFINILFLATLILGVIACFGLFRFKQWGRKYLNWLIAAGILIHIFQVIDGFLPDKFGHTLIEHSSGAIFFYSRFTWQSILTMYLIIGVFFLINSKSCANLLKP